VTTSFAILSMLLSAFLAGTTYLLIQGSSLERRETLAKDAAFLNARAVRDELSLELSRQPSTGASGRPSIVDILPTAVGSVALLKFDQAWYVGDSVGKLSSGVGKLTRDDIPTAAEVELGQGKPVIMRYRLRGEPVLVVGVPMRVTPSSTISGGVPADYFEVSSLADLESTFETMVIALAGAGALTTVAGALLGRWASKRVLAPLGDGSEAVEAIASSDLDTRLPRTNDPDLGPLIGSFNHMVATLQERIERDGRFASDVSHELRSPLTTLTASVAVLQQNREDLPEPARQAVDLLGEEFERFQQLVSDLLEISRFDAGAQRLERSPLVVGEFVRQAAQMVCRHPVPVVVDGNLDEMVVMADKRRLVQVLRNLSDNAEKYANGATEIRVSQVRGGIELSVTDDGPGVPDSERQLIFDRFARGVSAGRRGTDQGTGLGLALVAEHVRLHGGTVRVEDCADGAEGSRFVVFLPAEPVSIYDAEESFEAVGIGAEP
jgi:two-component system sensor histidine kinase MtrB